MKEKKKSLKQHNDFFYLKMKQLKTIPGPIRSFTLKENQCKNNSRFFGYEDTKARTNKTGDNFMVLFVRNCLKYNT